MAKEDPLKARVVYSVDGQSFECAFLTKQEAWQELVDQIFDISVTWVHVTGKINDIDANRLDAWILRDAIRSFDCITVNGM